VAGLASARVFMTADNSFELWVNGHSAGTGNTFREVFQMDIAGLLQPGTNVLAVLAENGGTAPNPAGLIGALVLRFGDGRVVEVPTDQAWQAAREGQGPWTTALAVGEGWEPAMELGPCGMAPWGATGPANPTPESFCDYSTVSRVLRGLGLAPDFETDAPSVTSTGATEPPISILWRIARNAGCEVNARSGSPAKSPNFGTR